MRSVLASLSVILLLAFIVLVVGLAAALGVAAIGWLVGRVFGLTQWQGTLVALGTTLGVGFLIYQLGLPAGPVFSQPELAEWNEDQAPDEMPVVPGRQQRPASGPPEADRRSTPRRTTKR